jgi:ATP-dependent protease ClpP protease subunit
MTEITLYGSVGESFWDEDYFTAKMVRDQIKTAKGPLTVRLNSGGGIATEGQAIYTALVDYPDEVTIVVDGAAASAASLIAMAGDRIVMRRGSWMLVHDPAQMFGYGRGTAEDHRELAAFLDKIGDAYAEVYAYKTGKDKDEARAIMRAETVYVGSEAVEAGFATEYEDEEASAVAAFDYRIYAHAPDAARRASERLGEQPSEKALAAIIAGKYPRKAKEAIMADTTMAAAEASVAQTAPAEMHKAKPEMTVTQVAKLFALAEKGKVPAATVTQIVEEGIAFDAAIERITDAWASKGDKDVAMPGAPTARILRDERETRRAGMEMALTAQLQRRDPADDRAHAYMGRTLVEMAAETIGYNGPLRSISDREHVLRMATHSTSDFPAIYENALNKTLEARYREAEPVYRSIASRRTFNDFRPHSFVRAGDFPELKDVNEGGEIQYGTLSDNKEAVLVKPYGIAVRISRQMLVNDEMDAMAQVLADRGRAVARYEDKVFFDMLLSGSNSDGPTLLETTRQVFNTTDLTKASGAAAITITSLSIGRANMMKQKSKDGSLLNIMPSILLVGADKQTEAEQIVSPITPALAASVNPFSGRLQVVATARITGNAWYLFANPADAPVFVYGFLSGFEAPRMRMDEPFGQQGMAFSVEHDFGCGAIDYRGAYKNAGA